jgi:hypothetical protein
MTKTNSFLKVTFGDSLVGKSWVVKKAWEMVKKLHITMSEAFTKAWEQAKRFNDKIKSYRVVVKGNVFDFVCTLEDAIAEGLEVVGDMTGNMVLLHNLSNRIYQQYDRWTELLQRKNSFTYSQDIFIMEIKGGF